VKVCLQCGERFAGAAWACPRCGTGPEAGPVPLFAPELSQSEDGFVGDAFAQLVQLEEESSWFRSRNRLVSWAVGRYAPRARSFLEVGCGTGYVLRGLRDSLPALRLVGTELHADGLALARDRLSGIELAQVDARRLPWEDEFDVVGAFDVLEHVDEDVTVLEQLRQTLVAGGLAVVTVPQHPALWSDADDYARHRRRYTRRELVGKLGAAGFTVVRTTSFVSLLLPVMAASRTVQRRRSHYDPWGELRSTGRSRRLLEPVMQFEEALIRRGINLPAGGSLLAVGQAK
jgi:SAM-dependent methyltransferase